MNKIVLKFSKVDEQEYTLSESVYGKTGIATDINYQHFNCVDATYTFQDTVFVSGNKSYTTEIGTFRLPEGDITYQYSYSGEAFYNGSKNTFQITSGTKTYLEVKGIITFIIKNDGKYKVTIVFK